MAFRTKYLYENNFFIHPVDFDDFAIYQIGESLCDEGSVMNNHFHEDYFEFSYILDGSGTIAANDVATPVKKGDLFFSFPREFHSIRADEDAPLRYFFLAFAIRYHSSMRFYLERACEIARNERARVYPLESVLPHFRFLLEEFEKEPPVWRLVFEQELRTLILKVLAKITQGDSVGADGDDNERLGRKLLCYRVMHYVDTHLETIERATEIADAFNYNYTYLSRVFKNTTGRNLADYIHAEKLEAARELLARSDLSVTEIAERFRYSTIHVFSRAFKLRYRIAPRDYRTAVETGMIKTEN